MWRDLLNFNGVNWWTLLGGLGTNFIMSIGLSLAGTYLSVSLGEGSWYAQYGAPLMILVVFLLAIAAGWLIAKIADAEPVKHAFLSSLGAVVPLLAAAVMSFNPIPFMMAAVALAGNMNGAMLAVRRRRRF
jgi:hypothetical protein